MKVQKKADKATKADQLPETEAAAKRAGYQKIKWKRLTKRQQGRKPPHPDAAPYVDGVGPTGPIRCWFDPNTGEYDRCYPLT
jgi:hypothetical protein